MKRVAGYRPFLPLLALVACLPGFAGTPAPTHPGLEGGIFCGYQGWFACDGDGANRGWFHWTKKQGRPGPGNVNVDLWPDVSELDPADRFDTDFKHADGRTAQIFSSFRRGPVLKHFEWMKTYGISGVFVQRFANGIGNPKTMRFKDTVLDHCREGARQSGRAYAIMYDLTGMRSGTVNRVAADWEQLRTGQHVTDDPGYLFHRGKPLVTIWGIGFGDNRAYTLAECAALIDDLKAKGCAVMAGVPYRWRSLKHDAVSDPALIDLLKRVDVISPWSVGRYHNPDIVAQFARDILAPDVAWCREHGVDYLPVAFPGFSWHNLHGGPVDQIPRRDGAFLWSQVVAAKNAGLKSVYVAMFDEVDEGTAIFKCVNDTPTNGTFVGYGGLPSDHYLWLTGQAGRLLRGELPATGMPTRSTK
jgi:hypothetical protein